MMDSSWLGLPIALVRACVADHLAETVEHRIVPPDIRRAVDALVFAGRTDRTARATVRAAGHHMWRPGKRVVAADTADGHGCGHRSPVERRWAGAPIVEEDPQTVPWLCPRLSRRQPSPMLARWFVSTGSTRVPATTGRLRSA